MAMATRRVQDKGKRNKGRKTKEGGTKKTDTREHTRKHETKRKLGTKGKRNGVVTPIKALNPHASRVDGRH
jgi:hypothetical protein